MALTVSISEAARIANRFPSSASFVCTTAFLSGCNAFPFGLGSHYNIVSFSPDDIKQILPSPHKDSSLRQPSLGNRIAAIIFLGSLLTVSAVLITAYRALVSDFELLLTQQEALETRSFADKVNQNLQLHVNALESLSYQLSDGDALLSIDNLERALAQQKTVANLFQAGLVVFDADAVAIAQNIFVPNRLGVSYRDRPHFREVLKTREPVISRPIIGRVTGLPLISFLVPIESSTGGLLGVAGGIIDLSRASILPTGNVGSGLTDSIFHILDTDNFSYVESSEVGLVMMPLPNPGEDLLIDAGLAGLTSGMVTDHSNEKWLYATSHLQKLGWLFLVAVPYEKVIAPVRASFLDFISLSVLITLALAALSYLLAKRAMAPLDRVTRQIWAKSSAHDFNFRLSETGLPEVRNLAAAFNHLMAEQEQLDKLKDDFISNVSHELRTPLTSVNGSLKLLNSGAAGDLPIKAQKMTGVALRNGERLQLLITDLLDFNKLSSGKMELNMEPVALASLVNEARTSNHSMALEYGVRLHLGGLNHQGVVFADHHRLRQIIDNLISNAIKFSPPGGTVTLAAESSASGTVRLTISDQGEGVPESFKSRLFERFSQAEAGTSRAGKGTGLGLAISHELATLMGAKIGFYNHQGAHFWVELPVTQP